MSTKLWLEVVEGMPNLAVAKQDDRGNWSLNHCPEAVREGSIQMAQMVGGNLPPSVEKNVRAWMGFIREAVANCAAAKLTEEKLTELRGLHDGCAIPHCRYFTGTGYCGDAGVAADGYVTPAECPLLAPIPELSSEAP